LKEKVCCTDREGKRNSKVTMLKKIEGLQGNKRKCAETRKKPLGETRRQGGGDQEETVSFGLLRGGGYSS